MRDILSAAAKRSMRALRGFAARLRPLPERRSRDHACCGPATECVSLNAEEVAPLIPFRNSLPYDIQFHDVYVSECPFCNASHVRLPIQPAEIGELAGGKRKKTIVFPCCHTRLRLVDADGDYLLADRPVR
jgi:hypothetical protein